MGFMKPRSSRIQVKVRKEERPPMADLRMALEALLHKWQLDQDTEALKEGLEALVKALMKLEVEGTCLAGVGLA